MNEPVLKALMQLFAIVASVQGVNSHGREIVRSFLRQQLNQELVVVYLRWFDQFLSELVKPSDKARSEKKLSVNSVKVLRICTEINAELMQKQKLVVLVRLIEFIVSDSEIEEQEFEFVKTVSDIFHFSEEEFSEIFSLITDKPDKLRDSESLLLVGQEPLMSRFLKARKRPWEAEGLLYFYHQRSLGVFLFRHQSSEEWTLSGQLAYKNNTYFLQPGSALRGTKGQTLYYSDLSSLFLADQNFERVSFQVKEVEYKFPSGKLGLHPINFSEDTGKLVGIMGGSGAGKSTLLSVLNGNAKPSKGEVLLNGVSIHAENSTARSLVGFVPQDDLLIEDLSVWENLWFNARLSLAHLSEEEQRLKVESVLQAMSLTEIRDLRVGSVLDKTISGGQRKRLNIGLELLREPPVLFVDEPTSGLSSRDSERVMDVLKELALKGKLIMVVIHQPSSELFKLFDRLLILDQGGYLIYNGNPVEAVVYFRQIVNHVNAKESECARCGHVNPEQIFTIIESRVLDEYGNQTAVRRISPQEWYDYAQDLIQTDTIPNFAASLPDVQTRQPSKWKQCQLYIQRDLLSKSRNKLYVALSLLEAPVLGGLIALFLRYEKEGQGYRYGDNPNIMVWFFVSILMMFFLGLMVSAEELIRERKIRLREQFLSLGFTPYLSAKLLVLLTLVAFQSFSLAFVGHVLLQIPATLFTQFLVLFSVASFAVVIGLSLSAYVKKAVTVYILIPFLIIPQMIFSGALLSFDQMSPWVRSLTSVPWIGEIMVSRWAYEAICVEQYQSNEAERPLYSSRRRMVETGFMQSEWLPAVREKLLSKEPQKSQIALEAIRDLASQVFGEAAVKKVSNQACLTLLEKHFSKAYQKAANENDAIQKSLRAQFKNDSSWTDWRLQNRNQYLDARLTYASPAVVEYEGLPMNMENVVYRNPMHHEFLRAPLFSPNKRVFGFVLSTRSTNLWVMSVMSVLVGGLLWYLGLRRRM